LGSPTEKHTTNKHSAERHSKKAEAKIVLFVLMSFLVYFSCVDNGSCEDILGVRTNLVCENQATQTCCHESKIKPSIEVPDEYEDEESCSDLSSEGYR
jgi:hypothetical protein